METLIRFLLCLLLALLALFLSQNLYYLLLDYDYPATLFQRSASPASLPSRSAHFGDFVYDEKRPKKRSQWSRGAQCTFYRTQRHGRGKAFAYRGKK